MDPKKKLEQLDGLVADLIIGQNRLVEEVTTIKEEVAAIKGEVTTIKGDVQQLVGFQRQSLEFQRQSFEFQRQSLEFQSQMSMQLTGIHDFMRQIAGEFHEMKAENKQFDNHESRIRTLETIVLKAS